MSSCCSGAELNAAYSWKHYWLHLGFLKERIKHAFMQLTADNPRTATTGLRSRVWNQHFWGGGKFAGSDLVQEVISILSSEFGISPDPANWNGRPSAQRWIRENCFVQ